MRGSWIFIKRRGFGLFSAACLTQTDLSNCDLSTVVKKHKLGQFWLAQSSQNEYKPWTAQGQ